MRLSVRRLEAGVWRLEMETGGTDSCGDLRPRLLSSSGEADTLGRRQTRWSTRREASHQRAVPPDSSLAARGRASSQKKERPKALSLLLVPASRLELLRLVATTPSRWRVYQFHHAGNEEIQVSPKARMRSMTGFAGTTSSLGPEREPEPVRRGWAAPGQGPWARQPYCPWSSPARSGSAG